MLKKTIIASLAVLIAIFAFQPVEKSEAKARVHIGVYPYGGYGYPPYYGGGYYPDPYYGGGYYPPRRRYAPTYRPRRISCRRAIRIVRNHGYRRVRARDCRGSKYSFTGKKRGRWYRIRMYSRSGRIYSVRRR